MLWVIKVDELVYKQLSRFPDHDGKRILSVIKSFSENPFAGDIVKIKGERDIWRRRAGNYRVFFEVYPDSRFISVFNVERRTSKTY